MRDNTVAIDRSQTPAALHFAPRFNAAVAFIDRHLAEGRRDKRAIVTARETVTYGTLAAMVNRWGNLLRDRGIGAGERLLMVVKDCPDFFYLFWGAVKAGIIPVPVNTLFRCDTYAYMIEDSGCAALAYSPEFADQVAPALAGAAQRPRVVLALDDGALPRQLAEMPDELAPAPTRADDDCFWLYSSGSTGTPKGAVHRHRDVVVTSQYYGVDTLGLLPEDICFSEAKLFFAYGLGNAMSFPLWVGGTAVLSDARPAPETTAALVERFRPTLYFGVPTLYAAHLRSFTHGKPDFSSVRACVSAGEALPAEILRRWRDVTGKPIIDGIGSTEALHIFISNRPGDVKPGSSGRVVPGYHAWILGENGSEAANGVQGRLFISGDSTARCYWNNPDRTAATMVNGWLDTGDTYYRDAYGYYYYCGRSDDMLKVGGIWCSPFEIEAKLIEHPGVLEAAVVGRADSDNLVKPEAFVVLKGGGSAADEVAGELLALCKRDLAPYKYPRWFNFVAELPKTATGKIQRFKLRQSSAAASGVRTVMPAR
jgi:benzoate-CoA ligase family protein